MCCKNAKITKVTAPPIECYNIHFLHLNLLDETQEFVPPEIWTMGTTTYAMLQLLKFINMPFPAMLSLLIKSIYIYFAKTQNLSYGVYK